jgi:hypothetical protein
MGEETNAQQIVSLVEELLCPSIASTRSESANKKAWTEEQRIIYDNSDDANKQAMDSTKLIHTYSIGMNDYISLFAFNKHPETMLDSISFETLSQFTKERLVYLKHKLNHIVSRLVSQDISLNDQYLTSHPFTATIYKEFSYNTTDRDSNIHAFSQYFANLKIEILRIIEICDSCLKHGIFGHNRKKISAKYRFGKNNLQPTTLLTALSKSSIADKFDEKNLKLFRDLLLNEHDNSAINFNGSLSELVHLIYGLHKNGNWNGSKSIKWPHWVCFFYLDKNKSRKKLEPKNRSSFKSSDHPWYRNGQLLKT